MLTFRLSFRSAYPLLYPHFSRHTLLVHLSTVRDTVHVGMPSEHPPLPCGFGLSPTSLTLLRPFDERQPTRRSSPTAVGEAFDRG